MKLKGKQSKSRLHAVVAAVALLGTAVAAQADITPFTPAAYAESELLVSSFRLIDTATGLPPTTGPGGRIDPVTASVASTLSASINGVPGVVTGVPSGTIINPLALGDPTISHYVSANAGGTYVPYATYLVGLGAGVFAGAASDHTGNGLGLNGAGFTEADTHAQVNINGTGAFGSADSRQTLGTTFTLTVAGGALTTDVLFDAEAYLRIALGQDGVVANATRSWGLTVRPAGSLANFVDWVPNGTLDAVGGVCAAVGACSELSDGFDLNFEANTMTTSDLDEAGGPLTGSFGLRVTLLPGTYIVTLSHETNADAAVLPEPGSLALVGASLVGFAGLRRRLLKKSPL